MMQRKILPFLFAMMICLCCGCGEQKTTTKETTEEVQTEETADVLIQTMTTKEMQEVFGAYDLTMVNIWATWCGPCVGEMPELSAMYNELPENLNMITVCTDTLDALQTAKTILNDCEATFMTLHPNEDVQQYFLNGITAYPTTLFVNREGEFVGEAVIGAHTAEQYLAEMNARLGE